MSKQLDAIMKPKSVALIGASSKENTVSSEMLARLKEYNFQGDLYPVNPKADTIQDLKAYKSVLDIPGNVDLAIIVIPKQFVLDTIDQCAEKGIKGVVIISAGFKETGDEGLQLEQDLVARLEKHGMLAVGPNCLGVINTNDNVRLDATFAEELPVKGDIAFVSQSGALGGGILNILKDLNVGFSQFVSIGNQAQVNAETMMEYWEDESDVGQILMYMESISNPVNFRNLATKITKKKPVIALKSGRSAAGASAASSHTGSLAGADMAADALLKQSGVIRETSLKGLFDTAKVFSNCPIPKGNKVAIITNSGGPGIMATDAICEHGMEMAPITQATKDSLMSFLPAAASVKNPIDMIASAPLDHYTRTLETTIADENVDMIMVIYLPFMGLKDIDVAKAVMDIKAKHPEKPVVGVFMTKNDFFQKLSEMEVNMPFYMYAEEAADALEKLDRQRKWVERPVGSMPAFDVDKNKAQNIIKQSIDEGREQLTTLESIDVLDAYGIRACKYGLATDVDQAASVANSIGYPVVMKMTSKTVSHKTDVGGVIVNIQSEQELRDEYNALIERLKEKNILEGLEGVIVQEMVKSNREMVCGIATDPQYGPMMMFGLGGVFIEVMKDVTFRLAPLTDVDAKEMIRSVKAFELLEGARGTMPAQIEQIEESLLRLSQLVKDFPFIDELDINPLLISEKNGEGIAVDGRIKVRMEEAKSALSCDCSNCSCGC